VRIECQRRTMAMVWFGFRELQLTQASSPVPSPLGRRRRTRRARLLALLRSFGSERRWSGSRTLPGIL
jgi:hypothetical protein